MENHKNKNIKLISDAIIIVSFLVCAIIELWKELREIGRMWLLGMIIAFSIYWFLAQCIIHFIKKYNKNIKEELERWILSDKSIPQKWKLFDKSIIAEYDISNLLSPVEAWFLYDMQIWKPDIVCIIYKRASMWIIKLSQKNWWLIIKKTWEINETQLPSYEYAFRKILFTDSDTIEFPNKWLHEELNVIRKWIKEYCIQKWRVYKKDVNSIIDISKRWNYSTWKMFIPFGRLFWLLIWIALLIRCLLITKKNLRIQGDDAVRLGTFMGFAIPAILVYICCYIVTIKKTKNKHTIKLTDEWKELVRKIHWYKKFLESCEENQLKEFMKEDPFYINKILPYAVALGLENTISNKISQNILDDNVKDIFLLEKII